MFSILSRIVFSKEYSYFPEINSDNYIFDCSNKFIKNEKLPITDNRSFIINGDRLSFYNFLKTSKKTHVPVNKINVSFDIINKLAQEIFLKKMDIPLKDLYSHIINDIPSSIYETITKLDKKYILSYYDLFNEKDRKLLNIKNNDIELFSKIVLSLIFIKIIQETNKNPKKDILFGQPNKDLKTINYIYFDNWKDYEIIVRPEFVKIFENYSFETKKSILISHIGPYNLDDGHPSGGSDLNPLNLPILGILRG